MNEPDPQEGSEFLPPWFTDNDDADLDATGSDSSRVFIWIGALAIVLILLLIPVLQAEILRRRRDALPDAEVERTAVLFASAMLFGRSEGQALLLADESARPDIRSSLERILDWPVPSKRARLLVMPSPCGQEESGSCFRGRIVDTGGTPSTAIRFGINDGRDGPKVIWVKLDEQIVHNLLLLSGMCHFSRTPVRCTI